jgi:hypothetical protein
MRPAGAPLARWALGVVAIGFGLVAQQLVVRPPWGVAGWALFAVAGLLLVVATWPQEREGAIPAWSGPVVYRRRLVWGVCAVAAVAGTVWLSMHGTHPMLAVLLWFLSFGLASLALRGARLSAPARPAIAWSRREAATLVAILLAGLVARTIWIDDVPRYYFEDEATVGFMVQDAFRARVPNLFTTGWRSWAAETDVGEERHRQWTLPSMAMALQALLVPLFGLNTTALRLSSSLFGTLAILTTYLLARELFTPRIAMLAGLLIACGRTAIDFSRTGVPPVQVAFFETLAFACWWRAVNRGGGLAYVWAGIGLALCMTSYNAAHIAPVLWGGWVGLSVLAAPRSMLRRWRGALVTLAVFLLAVQPFLLHVTDSLTFGPNWQDYTAGARDRQVGTDLLSVWDASGAGAAWAIVRRQAALTWLGFGVIPAGAYELGYRGGGMLDHVSAPLFVLGLALAVGNLHRARAAFVLYWWLATTAVLGLFTEGTPAFVRLTGLLPALALLGALPLDGLLRATPAAGAARMVTRAGIAALLAVMAWDNWRTYFIAFPHQTRQARADVARYLADAPPDATGLMIGAEYSLRFGWGIFRLNFPGRRFEDVAEPSHLLPLRTSAEAPVALIFAPTQLLLADYAQALYPDTPISDVHGGDDPEPMFRAMLLSPAQIAARQGLRLEMLDARGTVLRTAVADPFSTVPYLPEACAEVRWSGSMYWPTDAPVSLTLRGGTAMSLAHRGVRARSLAEPAARVALQLPRGWQPVSITDTCTPSTPLELAIEQEGIARLVLTRDLRPDGADEGLRAVYRRDDQPVLQTIDPQINYFAPARPVSTAGGLFRAPTAVGARPPVTANWRGLLQVDTPGTYEFEVANKGGEFFAVMLGDEPLIEQSVPKPDEPRRVRATRALTSGLHPLVAQWNCTAPDTDSHRYFQLLWKPPDGSREIIPPTRWRRADAPADPAPLPTLEVLPTPTPVGLPPGSHVALTDLQPIDISFGFARPWIDRSEGGGPLSIGGTTYRRGIGMHAWGKMTYPVPPNAVEFEAVVGLSNSVKWCKLASVRFEVRDARDNLLYASGDVDNDTAPQVVRVRVAGTPTVTLIVTDAGDGFSCDQADWGDPSFILQ